jgi:hypothetical protein
VLLLGLVLGLVLGLCVPLLGLVLVLGLVPLMRLRMPLLGLRALLLALALQVPAVRGAVRAPRVLGSRHLPARVPRLSALLAVQNLVTAQSSTSGAAAALALP